MTRPRFNNGARAPLEPVLSRIARCSPAELLQPDRARSIVERCDSCGHADQGVAMCCGCYRNRCDRKKCADEHLACFTPDDLVDW